MKRVLAVILCALMLLGVLTSCTTIEGDNKGMIIDIYLATELFDFDPANNFNDDAMVKFYDLIYEGLTDLDENGKWKKALMSSYKVGGNEDDGYYLLITLNTTKWSDGRTVQAADFVYAWKRILDPDYQSEAASLLFDIKNARTAKLGDCSVDDIGLAAVDTYVLQVTFEGKIDVDAFLTTVASPALVPLREDVITREEHWAKQSSTIITNGPFAIKEMTNGEIIRLERSGYYYLDTEDDTQAVDTYVIPYRLITNYSYGDLEAQLAKYEAGELFYLGEIALSAREKYQKEAVITDELATHTYVFNTENPLFADSRVRQALSLAIDREEIVNIVTYAKAATGLIPYPIHDANAKGSFRTTGGDVISSSADVAAAQALLKEAGVSGGSFTLSIRPNEVDRAIATYVKSVWDSLGFDVTVEEVAAKKIPDYEKAYKDTFSLRYAERDFDVMAIDLQMLSTEAFPTLAAFATSFSGNGVDMDSPTYDLYGHVSGYASEAYDALIESAYAEKDSAARLEILHQAEELLMQDMPVIPLIFLQDAYLIHSDLSGYSSTYYGTRDFKRMRLKNYVDYLPIEASTDDDEDDIAG